MSDPVELTSGMSTDFPTWPAGQSTTLYVESMEDQGGQVTVRPRGIAQEEIVNVVGKKTDSIKRDWASVRIAVSNTGQSKMKVWSA
jgi:hypothetical protein